MRLRDGSDVPVDVPAAARYLKLAADQGHRRAQFFYPLALRDGCGISANLEESKRYFDLAAAQGMKHNPEEWEFFDYWLPVHVRVLDHFKIQGHPSTLVEEILPKAIDLYREGETPRTMESGEANMIAG
jgi:TPR repeat protein